MAFDLKTILERHAALRRSRQLELAQSGQLRVYEWKAGETQRDITEENIRRVLAEIAMLEALDSAAIGLVHAHPLRLHRSRRGDPRSVPQHGAAAELAAELQSCADAKEARVGTRASSLTV
jgi:hypothetical protein